MEDKLFIIFLLHHLLDKLKATTSSFPNNYGTGITTMEKSLGDLQDLL